MTEWWRDAVDQVYSHTSKEHPWFVESRRDRANPRADWYVRADAKADGTAPDKLPQHSFAWVELSR